MRHGKKLRFGATQSDILVCAQFASTDGPASFSQPCAHINSLTRQTVCTCAKATIDRRMNRCRWSKSNLRQNQHRRHHYERRAFIRNLTCNTSSPYIVQSLTNSPHYSVNQLSKHVVATHTMETSTRCALCEDFRHIAHVSVHPLRVCRSSRPTTDRCLIHPPRPHML